MNRINWKAILIAGLVVLMLANIAALVTFIRINNKIAERRCPADLKERHHYHKFHHELHKELGLNEQQIEKFTSLRQKYADEARNHFQEIKIIRDSIFTQLISEKPDTAIINEFNIKLLEIQQDLTNLTYNHIIEVKKVLTREQQDKYFKFLSKRIPGFHHPKHKPGSGKDNCPPPPLFEE